ncbi:MAG: ABC transporter ATP-binding protein, partial [Candidatus Sumerlaeota bacterium]|nr:ABC transporter ATP-binding protein [Candidatus Sumerlaeota bacterium]
FVSGMELALPYIIKVTIDVHIAHRNMAGITRMSILYLALLIGMFSFEYGMVYILNVLGQRAMRDLRMQIFDHVQSLSLSFFDKNPVGRLVTRITNDVEVLNELCASGVVTVFGDLFLLLGIMLLMLVVNWRLALIVFVTIPLLVVAAERFRIRIREVYRRIRISLARLNSFLQESLSGMRTIQVYNQQAKSFAGFKGMNDEYRRMNMEAIFEYAFFFPLVEFVAALGTALLVWYGGGGVVQKTVTIGTLILFLQYINRFFHPIRDLSEKYNIFQSAMASSERMFNLLDTHSFIVEPENPAPAPHLEKGIEFKNVWFAYHGDDYVLRDVTLSVPKGRTVAIVGSTGAGKTSLIQLLCRFYDYNRGEISIDDTDIRRFRSKDLRSQIGLVLQDVFLFSGNIAENIRLGNNNLTEHDIESIARTVNAHNFISNFSKGYHQEVRERGATFSQGQRQLLAFARALARDPQILILDEATSNIDTATELLIQDALGRLLAGRTSIVIAHRLSTIRRADSIIVLHKGRVHETGSHQELISKNGIYRRLYELQYLSLEEQNTP